MTVDNLKVTGVAIGDELDVHMRLLSDLENNVDAKDSKIRRVTQRAEIFIEKSNDCCLCMTVLGLVLLLVFTAVYL